MMGQGLQQGAYFFRQEPGDLEERSDTSLVCRPSCDPEERSGRQLEHISTCWGARPMKVLGSRMVSSCPRTGAK
ncbi:hypothetical protein EYF80_063930 [Liparis tanakae]|uniref:Uncharacterized protein n=1 Tax=Liparis tanakae TaxID=230148 RepID=A0A4Z2EBK8_9TELE|nr:hypothetical protein EYF80_063930 [Liparis tanakae]